MNRAARLKQYLHRAQRLMWANVKDHAASCPRCRDVDLDNCSSASFCHTGARLFDLWFDAVQLADQAAGFL